MTKIQHQFMIKTLSKVGLEGTLSQYNKGHNVTNASFFLKIRNKTRMSTFTTFIQHSIGTAIKQEKETEVTEIGKEEVNCHCLQMTILYT